MGRHAFHGSERERPVLTASQQLAGTMFDQAVAPRARRKATPASHAAAQQAIAKATDWTRLALALYASGLELTPDETSDRIDWNHERNIKPRISNLLKRGSLVTTGEQRPFANGVARRGPGDVLKVTDQGIREYQRRRAAEGTA